MERRDAKLDAEATLTQLYIATESDRRGASVDCMCTSNCRETGAKTIALKVQFGSGSKARQGIAITWDLAAPRLLPLDEKRCQGT